MSTELRRNNHSEREGRALDALIAMALHPRSEEIQAGVLKKLEELESRLSALRAKGWKITRHEDYRIGWEYVHDDYDGAPDSGDNRCGWGSLMDCIEAMEEHEEARP